MKDASWHEKRNFNLMERSAKDVFISKFHYIREKESLYNFNELESQCLVWQPLFFNVACTFFK